MNLTSTSSPQAERDDIAAVRPDAPTALADGPAPGCIDQWTELASALDGVLGDIGPDAGWLPRLAALHDRVLQQYDREPEASLYWLVFRSGHTTEHYSSHHALLCALVARDAAHRLGWPDELVASLTFAALTMNVSMRRLQDQLAAKQLRISASIRADINSHPERSARVLAAVGVTDQTMIGIVRLHHDDSLNHLPLDGLGAVERAARLLRRIDIFTAKLSRRLDRAPMSPMRAAREVCLGPAGVPDEIGAALLKATGLYPPGSFVALHSGEVGIVIARGGRADQPKVAALVGPTGTPLEMPELRDVSDGRFTIKGAVGPNAVGTVPPHELLLSLR